MRQGKVSDKQYLSADEYLSDIWHLASQVRRGGWQPDVLIALWRGGAPVGVAVHEFLKVTGWKPRHIAVKCFSYSGIGENENEVRFEYADEVVNALKPGERVLVVDDVFDTGKTAAAIKVRLDARGVDMRLATVYWKPTKNRTTLKPDFYVRELPDRWIVFPHEMEGLTPEELVEKDPQLKDLMP